MFEARYVVGELHPPENERDVGMLSSRNITSVLERVHDLERRSSFG